MTYIPLSVTTLKDLGFWNVGAKELTHSSHTSEAHMWKWGDFHQITYDLRNNNWYSGDYSIYPKTRQDIETLIRLFTQP